MIDDDSKKEGAKKEKKELTGAEKARRGDEEGSTKGGKKKSRKYPKAKVSKLKRLGVLLLILIMAYLSVHIYFIWQPTGKPSEYNQKLMDLEIAGFKLFPALSPYDLGDLDGRNAIVTGQQVAASPLDIRLQTAIERDEPVTFTEAEINHWLRQRLNVKQGSDIGAYVSVQGVWVNLAPGEIELVIERELSHGFLHVVTLFMKFVPAENGFTIHRHSSRVGQVKLPGGFARLVMPSFENMAKELTKELKLYKDESLTLDKQLKLHEIKVDNGRITLDPRLKNKR